MAGIMAAAILTGCSGKTNEKDTDQATGAEAAAGTESATNGQESASESLFGTFETLTLDGEKATDAVFEEADLTMVNIWGTFCGPCIKEMPDLGELSREYADKGVQIVGMISDVSAPQDETALEIIEHTKADYTHLILSKDLMKGYLGTVQAVPTTVFVDREGKQIGEAYPGAKSKEDWSSILDEMLELAAKEE